MLNAAAARGNGVPSAAAARVNDSAEPSPRSGDKSARYARPAVDLSALRDARLVPWPSRRLAGWVLVGVSGSIAELAVLRLLYEGLHLALPIATLLAAELLIVIKFALSDRFVFGHAWPSVRRALRYHGACAGALVVYWLVINGLSAALGVPYLAAFVVGTAAAFAWSLLTNFLWVWAT